MDKSELWQWVRRHGPPLLGSLLLHVAVLGPLCLLTWVVASAVTHEQVISLRDPADSDVRDDSFGVGVEAVGPGSESDDVAGLGGATDRYSGGAAGKGNDGKATGSENNAYALPALGSAGSALTDVGQAAAPAEITGDSPTTGSPVGKDAGKGWIKNLSGAAEGVAGGGGQGGVGGSLLRGTSKGFGEYVGTLRGKGLDIVLVLDATDSMTPYITQAKQRLHQVMDVVTALVNSNVRVGVVAYKDYGDEYGPTAVKVLPLSGNVQTVHAFFNDLVAGGGGDEPEPIHQALKAAIDKKMGWTTGRKWVIILAGDSTIHSSGRSEAMQLARNFASQHGTINVIDCGGVGQQQARREQVLPDLLNIAKAGGGSAFLLRDEQTFWQYLIVSVFGERFKDDVDIIVQKYVKKG